MIQILWKEENMPFKTLNFKTTLFELQPNINKVEN